MAISVTLNIQMQEPPVTATHGFRIVISATDAVDMPTEIFRYIELPPVGNNPATSEFDGICSTLELVAHPVDAPDPLASPKWFRKSDIDILVPSWHIADEWRRKIVDGVTTLVRALNAQASLTPPIEIQIT